MVSIRLKASARECTATGSARRIKVDDLPSSPPTGDPVPSPVSSSLPCGHTYALLAIICEHSSLGCAPAAEATNIGPGEHSSPSQPHPPGTSEAAARGHTSGGLISPRCDPGRVKGCGRRCTLLVLMLLARTLLQNRLKRCNPCVCSRERDAAPWPWARPRKGCAPGWPPSPPWRSWHALLLPAPSSSSSLPTRPPTGPETHQVPGGSGPCPGGPSQATGPWRPRLTGRGRGACPRSRSR